VWRIAYPGVRRASGRIASTVIFCGEFSQFWEMLLANCEMFWAKKWKCSPLAFFLGKMGKIPHICKNQNLERKSLSESNFDMSQSLFFSGDISLFHNKIGNFWKNLFILV